MVSNKLQSFSFVLGSDGSQKSLGLNIFSASTSPSPQPQQLSIFFLSKNYFIFSCWLPLETRFDGTVVCLCMCVPLHVCASVCICMCVYTQFKMSYTLYITLFLRLLCQGQNGAKTPLFYLKGCRYPKPSNIPTLNLMSSPAALILWH